MKKNIIVLLITTIIGLNLSGQELDLKSYMNLVEENSKDLKIAEIDQKLAAAQEKLARSATLPMIAGSAGYARNLLEITTPYPVQVAGDGVNLIYADVPYNTDNEFSFSVGLEQLLFDMSVFKALEASRQYREMTGTIYEATRQGILTAAKQVYYQTVLLDEVFKVKEATEQNAFDSYQDVLKRFESELASELEVLQAEVNWQINIPETTQAARNRDLAMSNLKHLAGLDYNAVVTLTDSLTNIPEKKETASLGTILGARPDYRAQQGELALREINISAKRAEFFPSLSATAGIGTSISNDDFSLEGGTEYAQLGLTLTIPVFYGGSRFAQMEQARLEKEQSQINLLKKQDEIRMEINNLNLLLDEASFRIRSAETTVKTAENAYGIMEVSSRNGLATQLDLKDARLNLSGAQLNYYSAIYDYLDAYFSWQQATGDGDQLPF